MANLPLDRTRERLSFAIEGRPVDVGDTLSAQTTFATPDYFHALRIPLIRGRWFDAHDDQQTPRAAVIDESFALRFFAGEDPIGRRIAPGARNLPPMGITQAANSEWMTIIGIVHDVKIDSLETKA